MMAYETNRIAELEKIKDFLNFEDIIKGRAYDVARYLQDTNEKFLCYSNSCKI